MTLPDTQSRIETVRGSSFPYRFHVDLFKRKVYIENTEKGTGRWFWPSELQRLATDTTMDPHRHALYSGAWEFYQKEIHPGDDHDHTNPV